MTARFAVSSTQIRPLGEEHLRMFRRMTQEREVVPRITLPKVELKKVILSDAEVEYKQAESTARNLGRRLATLTEFCMNKKLVKANREKWFFIDWMYAQKQVGWYHIDRKRGILTKITDHERTGLEWHERLYFNPSALNAIKEKRPLTIGITDGGRESLGVVGYSGSAVFHEVSVAQVAFVKDD